MLIYKELVPRIIWSQTKGSESAPVHYTYESTLAKYFEVEMITIITAGEIFSFRIYSLAPGDFIPCFVRILFTIL